MQVRVRSYASRNQLAAYPGQRAAGQELEWERRCAPDLATLLLELHA